MKAMPLSSPECSYNSDDMTTKLIIELRLRVSYCQVYMWTLGAELAWTQWAKARPPDTVRRVPPPGLTPGVGKGDLVPKMFFVIRGLFGSALSGPSPRTCLPWEALPAA